MDCMERLMYVSETESFVRIIQSSDGMVAKENEKTNGKATSPMV